MTGKYFKYKTKSEYLKYLWNVKRIKSIKILIREVRRAETDGTLVIKRSKIKSDETYEKNIRWYMGQLERNGEIKGFLGPVGRPKGRKNTAKSSSI